MTTKEKILVLAEQYQKENEYPTIESVLDCSQNYEPTDFIKTLGDQTSKDFKTPEIYWNNGGGDDDEYYIFVTLYSQVLKNSIILDYDNNIHKFNDINEIIDQLVCIWDQAEVLENKLSQLK